jgi:hypothetical protein
LLAKAGLPHPHECKFSKLEFLRFQTLLYDSRKDIFRVIYPGERWIKERYNCKGILPVILNTIKRSLDLAGFRKRKKLDWQETT